MSDDINSFNMPPARDDLEDASESLDLIHELVQDHNHFKSEVWVATLLEAASQVALEFGFPHIMYEKLLITVSHKYYDRQRNGK